MRTRQTFLLTILTPEENETPSLCGRLKVIASGNTFTFSSTEELNRLIASEVSKDFFSTQSCNSTCKQPEDVVSFE